jgi:porin
MKFDKLAACAFRLNERSRPAGVATGEWRRSAKAGISFFGSTVWVSSYALILLGTNASLAEGLGKAQQPTERAAAKMQPHDKMQHRKKREKKISKAKVQELTVKAPVLPVVTDSAARAAALDKRYGLHGWNIPYPSFGDTLLQDAGGFRTELAKYGIGFISWNTTQFAINMLNTPTTNNGTQAYWGQRFGVTNTFSPWLTYDLSQFGIPDGQIQLSGIFVKSSWQPYLADTATLARLSYYQTFLDKKLEMDIGIMGNGGSFIGINVGGMIQSPFGPNASIPTELGLASTSVVQPTAWFNYHITDSWYDTFAVMRSLSPTPSVLIDEQAKNPTGFDLSEQGANAIYLNELGYKTAASPDRLMTWVRGGAIYNSSLYHDFATGGMSTKNGFYLLADQQILQLAPGSAPGRGLYVGASAMYTPPETSIFSQYYEARLYGVGLLDARPRDFVSLVYSHNEISKFAANPINLTAALTGTFAQYNTNSLVASYTMRVTAGLYVTAGVNYTDHPSFTFIPKEGSALNFLASAFLAF